MIVSLVVLVGLPEFSNLVEARHNARTLATDIARLRQDNDALRAKVRSLREDPEAIEDVARRELGMLRPGEILFIIKDVSKAQTRDRGEK
jgi:cell division protein FtsB